MVDKTRHRPSPELVLKPGQMLAGAYRIVRPLGRGGMGEVYEAAHARLAGRYAIKLLVKEISTNDEALRRFRREAEVTSRLRHPNIVPVIDFDRMDDGTLYMVMELLEGRDLASELGACGRLPLARAADIVDQVASGLAAAHAAQIVHRDLKPGNLFLSPLPGRNRELVRILDFGISKVRTGGGEALTRSQSLMGTPRYMAPEQARGLAAEIDFAADQFALATIAYEMLAGRPAFDGGELASVVYQIVHDEPPTLEALGLPELRVVEPVLRRALAKAPGDRYPSVHDFAQRFVDAARGGPAIALPAEPAFARGGTLRSVRAPLPAVGQPTTMGLSSGELGGASRRGARPRRAVVGIAAAALAASVGLWVLANDGPPAPQAATAAPPAAPAPPAPTAPADIMVQLDNLPPQARVEVDGRPAALPLRLRRDDARHRLTVTAPGFRTEEQWFEARADLIIRLAAQEVPAAPARARRPARKSNLVQDL